MGIWVHPCCSRFWQPLLCLICCQERCCGGSVAELYHSGHGARTCLRHPSCPRWDLLWPWHQPAAGGPSCDVRCLCCWRNSPLSVMPAHHSGEAWLVSQGALSLKEAKLWCHSRTAGDGGAGQAPESCMLLLCHSWSTGWDGSPGCWGVLNLLWCPLPALSVTVMAVHPQGRAVCRQLCVRGIQGWLSPGPWKGAPKRQTEEFYDLSKGRLWDLL